LNNKLCHITPAKKGERSQSIDEKLRDRPSDYRYAWFSTDAAAGFRLLGIRLHSLAILPE
jgi:hypothetical protein